MSIAVAVRAAVSAGALRPLLPRFSGDLVRRLLLMSREVATLLEEGHDDARIQFLRADLESFVRGETISVSLNPYRHRAAYMGLLAPEHEGIWEIRSRKPEPGLRVFGRFAQRDVFIALTWGIRSRRDLRWPHKAPLGARNSNEYHFAQLAVIEQWDALLTGHAPLIGGDIGDLLSDKYNRG